MENKNQQPVSKFSIFNLPNEMRLKIIGKNAPVITIHQLGAAHHELSYLTEGALRNRHSLILELGDSNSFNRKCFDHKCDVLPRQVQLQNGTLAGVFRSDGNNENRYRVPYLTREITEWFVGTFKKITSLEVIHDRLGSSLPDNLINLLDEWGPKLQHLSIWFAKNPTERQIRKHQSEFLIYFYKIFDTIDKMKQLRYLTLEGVLLRESSPIYISSDLFDRLEYISLHSNVNTFFLWLCSMQGVARRYPKIALAEDLEIINPSGFSSALTRHVGRYFESISIKYNFGNNYGASNVNFILNHQLRDLFEQNLCNLTSLIFAPYQLWAHHLGVLLAPLQKLTLLRLDLARGYLYLSDTEIYPNMQLPTVTVLELVIDCEQGSFGLHLTFPKVQVLKIEKQTTFNHRTLVDAFIGHCPALKQVYVDSILIHEAEPDAEQMETQSENLNYVTLMDQSVYYTARFAKPDKNKPLPYYVNQNN